MQPFRFKQFSLSHSRSPMPIGTDAVSLGAIAPARGRVLDIGCGCGVIGLMLAQRGADAVTMIDIDPEGAAEARANALASPWTDRIEVMCADFLATEIPGLFDSIVSNPPFFGEGMAAPDARRAAARSEAAMPPDALLKKAATLLAPEGTITIIIPADRLAPWLEAAAFTPLYPRRIIQLKTKPSAPPKRLIITFAATPGPLPDPEELSLNSPDYKTLTAPFYL